MFDFLILIIKNEVFKFKNLIYRSISKVNICICNEYKKYLLWNFVIDIFMYE